MSDLHHAVQAEIASHTPSQPPSFDALKARKRTRDRRRTLTAVAASALAVAGIAFVPSTFLGDGGPPPAQVAGEDPPEVVQAFSVKATDTEAVLAAGQDGQDAISRCVQAPGLQNVAALFSSPAQWSGRVVGQDNADALKACVEAVPGWGVTVTPFKDMAAFRAYTVRPSMKTVLNSRLEEERDACFSLPGVDAVGQGESQPVIYKVKVGLGQSLAFEQCISGVVGLYVPELDGPPQTPGDAATWAIDPQAPPQPDATTFTALVSRVGCSSGETGEVFSPQIEESPDRVVVTFSVSPLPSGFYGCPGNKPVRVEVRLAEPMGNRIIEDGACRNKMENGKPVCQDGMRYPVAA